MPCFLRGSNSLKPTQSEKLKALFQNAFVCASWLLLFLPPLRLGSFQQRHGLSPPPQTSEDLRAFPQKTAVRLQACGLHKSLDPLPSPRLAESATPFLFAALAAELNQEACACRSSCCCGREKLACEVLNAFEFEVALHFVVLNAPSKVLLPLRLGSGLL